MVEAQILVVEDETIVAMEIQDRLKGLGYHIAAVVSSGEEAIRKAAETKPDLALMDVVLKGSMDGVEAAEHIRTRFNIPVIYLTAYADDVTFQRAKTTEPYGYIIKPFEERELYTAIEMALYKHQVERKLKESEERYRFLYEDNPSMYFTVDTEGTVLSVNQFGAEQLGYTVEELKGQSVLKFFHPDDQKAVLEQLSMCLNNPSQIARWEFRKVRKDRSIMWVSETARAIRDADGRTVILIVCEDITEKRKLEEELLKTQKLESIGILAGGIAHDFNNILTAIMGNISLAKADINPASEAFEILTEAEKASLRARELAHKLLTFSKGGAPVKDIVSIADLIKDSTAFALSGSNVRCEFSLPDHLWAVEADVSQLSQVIQNLVINAIQAMPEGGTIQIYAENIFLGLEHGLPLQPGNYVKLSVVDSGVGIPAQHLPKIFDPYFTTKKKGTGLGLATAYSIIKKHGGYITVESEVDVGTTFYIYLPASEKPIPAKEKAEKVLPPGKGRILVMDDEDSIRSIVSRMLTRLGYEVVLATDGAEAIEKFLAAKESGRPFNVIILDLTVPGGMGGKETIKKLLEIDPNVKAIVSSGYSNDPIMADFKEYGFSGVIVKPYQVEELKEALNKVIL